MQTIKYSNGSTYTGLTNTNGPHGNGVLTYANGFTCEGEFVDGKAKP